jgi:hypothetical protein
MGKGVRASRPARTCYSLAFAAPKADLSSDQAPFQDTVPTMVGWQPLEPAGEPVPVIRKQLLPRQRGSVEAEIER